MTDIQLIRRAVLRKEIAALKAECLAFDAGLRAARLALWLRFDPDQPRVPAGSPDGGQWTSGGGGGLGTDPAGSAGDNGFGAGETPTGSDDGDDWKTIARGVGPDGTRTETSIRSDGTTIRSEYAASRAAGFDERHTVATPDGSVRTFETEALRQSVRDELGEVLSRSEFKPDGAVLEPAFLPAVPLVAPVVGKTLQLGMILYVALSARNGPDAQAVAAFTSREYTPGASTEPQVAFVGQLTRDQVEQACPRLPEVQERADIAADAFAGDRTSMSPQQYGTAVHTHLKHQIDGLLDPDFRAEVSFLKSRAADYYGQRGSIRIDVLERSKDDTVCVYDIKTGEAALGPWRSFEMVDRVRHAFPRWRRMIITEIRPTR